MKVQQIGSTVTQNPTIRKSMVYHHHCIYTIHPKTS